LEKTTTIKALDHVDGIERYRISSIEPNLITEEIIRFISTSNKFLHHFHIPMQSGSDKLLKQMKRRYNTDLFRNKIEQIIRLMPDTFIGIDVIVGFPGEGEDEFEETYRFLEGLEVSFLHVFSYSVRPGTPAETMPGHVSHEQIKLRSERLHRLSETKHLQFYRRFIGTEHNVLFESAKKDSKMFGFTGNYMKVETSYDKELINTIRKFKILDINANGNAGGTIV
jgi:threonylcarbamoyladenosine tRNA methylthiotransferase MtaB